MQSTREPVRGARSGRSQPAAALFRGWRRWVPLDGWRAYAVLVLLAGPVVAVAQLGWAPQAVRAAAGARSAGGSVAWSSRSGQAVPRGRAPVEVIELRRDRPIRVVTNPAARLVLVSLSRQHAWMCELHRQGQFRAGDDRRDQPGDATATGSWLLENKQRNRHLAGRGYRDFVRF